MGVPIKKEKSYLARFFLLIMAVTILLIAGTLSILYFGLGYRIVSYRYETEDSGAVRSVRALVRIDADGEIFSGNAWCNDGTEFKIERVDTGYYKIQYSNGDIYEGGLDRLLKNGYGRLELANGDVYEGSFSYDTPWGEGVYTYFNGDVYEGGFYNGKKSGEGIYMWAVIEGEIQRKYEGNFANDMRNGYGVYYYADGSIYQGEFVNDLKTDTDATLIIKNADGTEDIYTGGFLDDIKSGYGEYRWDSGAVYVGDFANDVMEGQGTYTWPDGTHSYTGTFKGNKPYIEVTEEDGSSENTAA